jgi:hypothetical protein
MKPTRSNRWDLSVLTGPINFLPKALNEAEKLV